MGLDGKKGHPFGPLVGWAISRLEVLEGPSGVSRVRRLKGADRRESLLPGVQVSEVARKHGATRWQIYYWRRFRPRGEMLSCEASQPPFAPLVVEGPLEKHHVPRSSSRLL